MALLDSDSWSYPGCIHVVVMPAGKQAGDAQCARVLRALRDVPPVQFKDAVIFPRFMKQEGMPKWVEHHLRWEELAAYKQVLGVLGVACCADRGELEEAEAAMSQSSASFRRTACCTKYLLLGPKEQLESLVAEREDLYLLGGPDEPLDAKVLEKAVGDMAWCVANTLHQNIRAASRPDSVKVFRSQFDLNNPSAEEEIKNLGRSVVQGRTQKHLGDLYLLSGLLQDASNNYVDAIGTLSSTRDSLWLASAYEGLSTVAIMSKRCDDAIGQRGHHTKLKRPSLTAAANALRATTGTLSRLFSVRRNAEASSVMDQGVPSPPSTQSFVSDKDMKDGGTPDDSTNGPVNGDVEAGEEEEQLRVDFIIKNYSRALENYRKDYLWASVHFPITALWQLPLAGSIADVPRIEATVRFTAFLANQELNADACEVLNDLSTLTEMSDEDKVAMYELMGDLCSSLGYTRKASFYYHCAAYLITASKTPAMCNGTKVLELIQKCFAGYRLPATNSNLPAGTAVSAYVDGWPVLKSSILRDYVLCATSHGDSRIIWCATFLLQHYGSYLQLGDLQEVIKGLVGAVQSQNRNLPSSHDLPPPQPLVLDAPLPLSRVPTVNRFRPKELQAELAPHRRPDFVGEGSGEGPFIYSALKGKKKVVRPEVPWVIGHPCEVTMEVSNPFPVEIRVEEMKAVVEGVGADVFSASLTLPVSPVPQNFLLLVVPKETGFLNILGYETVIFGLRSRCTVKIPGDPVIKVVPPLPMLKVRSTVVTTLPSGYSEATPPNAKDAVAMLPLMLGDENDAISLMDGESCVCEFQVESTNETPVDKMFIASEEWDRDYCHVSCNMEAVGSSLPLTQGQLTKVRVTIIAQIPPYLRVNNDFTKGIAKSSLLSYSPGSITTRLSDEQFRSLSSSPERAVDPNISHFNPRSSVSQSPAKPTNFNPADRSGGGGGGDKMAVLPRHNPSQSPSGGRRTISVRKKVGYDEIDLSKVHRRSLRLLDGSPDQRRHKVSVSADLDSVTMHKSETLPAMSGYVGEDLLESQHSPSYSPVTRGGVVISEPTGPLLRAVPTPSPKRQVKGVVRLSYAGEAGHAAGYCRLCELRTTVNIKPSLVFENFDVYQVEGYHHLWCLTFVVKNLSKFDLDITTIISPECSDAPECSGKLPFKLLSKRKLPLNLKLKRFLIPDSEMTGTVSQSNVTKMYCDRIAKWIKFYWSTHKGLEGVVDLTGLRLPMATLDFIKPAPIHFVMKLNGKQYKSHGEVLDCKAGMPTEMVLNITNTSGFPLPPSTLKILPFQFSQQENKIKDVMGNVFIHTNTLTTSVPQLETGHSFTHVVFLVFLLRGTYHVKVNLSTEDSLDVVHIQGEGGAAGKREGGAAGSSLEVRTAFTSQAGSQSCPEITVSGGSPPLPPSSTSLEQRSQGRQFTGPHIVLSIT